MDAGTSEKVFNALETFRMELPSWGFANTGTRFGKFIQAAAATTTEEKFSDAGQVHQLTGVCPTVALHVLWDCPDGVRNIDEIKKSMEALTEAVYAVTTKIYQKVQAEQAAQQQPAGAAAPPNSESKDDDNVVNADYKVKEE